MSAIKGNSGTLICFYLTIWRLKPLQNMMMDYSIHNVRLHRTVFTFFKTVLHTVNFHVKGWEMTKTQREGITPIAAPLQRSYGVVAFSQKYQNLKKSERLHYRC